MRIDIVIIYNTLHTIPKNGDERMNLGNLAAGDVAIVVKVRSQSAALVDQLAARGIHPGAQISVLRHGDPIAVALEETRWAMSKEHADHIEVSVIEAPCLT